MNLSRDLLPAVEAIYDAAADPLQWPRALGAIADYFGDVGAMIEWRKDSGLYRVIISERLEEANRDFAENNWSRFNFKGERGARLGLYFNGEPFADRHLCTDEEMLNEPFCRDFLFKHDLGRCAGVAISPNPDVGIVLSIQRSFANKPAFTDAELAIIQTLGRHMEKSLRLSIRLLDAELLNRGLGETLTRIGIGVFALDSKGNVIFANPTGRQLPDDAIAISKGRLLVKSASLRRAFEHAVAQTIDRGFDSGEMELKPTIIESASSSRRFVLYLLPVASSQILAEQFFARASVIVLAIEQKASEPADPTVVRDALGLTLGEARVASLIGSGVPPKDAAERLGIAHETARSHLRSVFAKVGVARQSELAALLTKLMLR